MLFKYNEKKFHYFTKADKDSLCHSDWTNIAQTEDFVSCNCSVSSIQKKHSRSVEIDLCEGKPSKVVRRCEA